MRRAPLAPTALLLPSLLAPACAGARLGAPPTLFPLTTAFTVPLEGLAQGDLAFDGERILVVTQEGVLRAIDPATGAVRWQAADRGGRLSAVAGFAVLKQADGTVWRIETETGVVRWRVGTSVRGEIPATVSPAAVVVAGTGVVALDPSSGAPLWGAADAGQASTPPVVHGGRVLLGESDGNLRCLDAASGATVWKRALGGPVIAPPVVDERGRVLLGTTSRSFVALSLADKGKLLWRWKLGADVRTPAAVVGSRVVFASYESVLWALERESGHVAWRTPLPSRPRSGPVAIGSAVLLACYETELVGFDGRTGRRLGNLRTPATFRTVPLVLGPRVFVGLGESGSLLALDLPPAVPVPSPSPSPSPLASASPGAATGSPAPGSSSSGEASPAPPQPAASPSPTPSPSPSGAPPAPSVP